MLLLAVGALAGCGTTPGQSIVADNADAKSSLTSPAPVELAFVETKGFLALKATVNGVAELTLLLDSGSPIIALFDTPATARLGLDTGQARRFAASVGASTITAQPARRLDFDFHGLTLDDHSAAVIPLAATPCEAAIRASGIDGVIGYDLLRRYVVQIDFDRDVLTLYDPAAHVYRGSGLSLPLRLRNLKPVITARWTTPTGAQHPIELHLDTGSSTELDVHGNGRPSFDAPAGAAEVAPACMLGGLVPQWAGGETTVEAGGVIWRGLTTTHVSSVDDPWDGVLGAGALAGYNLVIDYPGERLILERRTAPETASSRDRAPATP